MFDRNFTAVSILECFRNKGDEAKSTEKTTPLYQKEFLLLFKCLYHDNILDLPKM